MSKEKNEFEKILETKDKTKDFEKKDINDNKAMALLSYIIAPVPFFVEKKSKFVKYHSKIGMNLFIIILAYSVIYTLLTSLIKVRVACGIWLGYEMGACLVTPWWVTFPLSLGWLLICALAIIGIVNVCNGKAKELPIINKFKIIK